MSLGGSPEKLQSSLKKLRIAWEETCEAWRDQVASDFERDWIHAIERESRRTVEAMQSLGDVLDEALRRCAPP